MILALRAALTASEARVRGLEEAADEALAIIKTVKHSPPFSARIERCVYLLKAALAKGEQHE